MFYGQNIGTQWQTQTTLSIVGNVKHMDFKNVPKSVIKLSIS